MNVYLVDLRLKHPIALELCEGNRIMMSVETAEDLGKQIRSTLCRIKEKSNKRIQPTASSRVEIDAPQGGG